MTTFKCLDLIVIQKLTDKTEIVNFRSHDILTTQHKKKAF